MIANDAGLESMDEYGETALIITVQNNHEGLTRWLLGQGAAMTYEYKREETGEMLEGTKKDRKELILSLKPDKEFFSEMPDDVKEDVLSGLV